MRIFVFKASAFFYKASDWGTDAYFNNLGVSYSLAGKE